MIRIMNIKPSMHEISSQQWSISTIKLNKSSMNLIVWPLWGSSQRHQEGEFMGSQWDRTLIARKPPARVRCQHLTLGSRESLLITPCSNSQIRKPKRVVWIRVFIDSVRMEPSLKKYLMRKSKKETVMSSKSLIKILYLHTWMIQH